MQKGIEPEKAAKMEMGMEGRSLLCQCQCHQCRPTHRLMTERKRMSGMSTRMQTELMT